MRTLPPKHEMERAYLTRDPAYNGIFFVGVRTTAVFCRPICRVRSPLPKNVEYFATAAEALFAGYRPCKRCHPMTVDDQPQWATRLIEMVEQEPSIRIKDGDLRAMGADPATVRRHFIRHYGMTFQAYTRSRRLSRAFHFIREGMSVDQAVVESGYESHSGFRHAFEQSLGCIPTESRARDCILLAWIQSPLGPLVAGANEQGVCLLEFTDRRMLESQFEIVRQRFKAPVIAGSNRHLKTLDLELKQYFDRSLRQFTVPIVYPGTDFQRRVWTSLLEVPYGQTRSYQELAETVGNRAAVRAVGRANGVNRIGIIIPCHRIVNKNGDLGGYGGGLRRKQYLINLEQSSLDS